MGRLNGSQEMPSFWISFICFDGKSSDRDLDSSVMKRHTLNLCTFALSVLPAAYMPVIELVI